jgi:hypothetical protein
VDTLSGQYQERFGLMWNEIELVGKAFGAQQGVKYYDYSDQEAAKWQKAVEPVITKSIKSMVQKGYPESEVKGWIAYMKERNKYWLEKQIEYKIPSPTGPAEVRPDYIAKQY